jgi:hypothetical protein
MDVQLRIGIDLDGCAYNFGDSVQRYLEHIGLGHLWKSGPTPTPYWEFYKDWDWTSAQFVKFCNDGADAGFIFCGPAREGAVEAIKRIKDLGHIIVIITDRAFGTTAEVSQNNTRNWLAEHKIPYDELHFSRDKTIVPTDMFVEDKLENYDALVAAGTEAYLINRPWNLVDPNDNRMRISSISEFASWVELKTQWLNNLTKPR